MPANQSRSTACVEREVRLGAELSRARIRQADFSLPATTRLTRDLKDHRTRGRDSFTLPPHTKTPAVTTKGSSPASTREVVFPTTPWVSLVFGNHSQREDTDMAAEAATGLIAALKAKDSFRKEWASITERRHITYVTINICRKSFNQSFILACQHC